MISSRSSSHSLVWKLSVFALLVILAVVLSARLSHPWTYNDDYNGAFWGQAARNLSSAGFIASAGVPAPLYYGLPPIPAEALYVHHPTLLAAMIWLDRTLLGESEAAARLLPVLFSLLTAGLLAGFTARRGGWRLAALVLVFYVAAPMELHYGQMVNFEAPELFFMLAALCTHHLWQAQRTRKMAFLFVISILLAMWTDWLGYLLAAILWIELVIKSPRRNASLWLALMAAAIFSGFAFLLQIRLASPQAWNDLFGAFRERSGHGNLSGGAFAFPQWLHTEATYLSTLYHPGVWLLAVCGAIVAWINRRRIDPRETALLHIGAALFLLDVLYVCGLRNQSYVHDFAGFYFLIPLAIYPGWLAMWMIGEAGKRWGARGTAAASALTCALAVALIWWAIAQLPGIDTQFCILDDDDTEPATLMPDVGRLIDQSFPPGAVIICNFDPYYSPLPYYARHQMVNAVRDQASWQQAIADARPAAAGGIIWLGEPSATDLASHFPPEQLRRQTIDGIPFALVSLTSSP